MKMIQPILKYALVSLVVVTSACVSNITGNKATVAPIFREINIGAYGKIGLGRPFEQKSLATSVSPGIYRLRQGIFGGAEEITIYTDGGLIIKSLRFDYGADADVRSKVAEYTASLGNPTGRAPSASEETIYWTDSKTRFEIVRKENAGKREVYSMMVDLVAP